MIASDFFSRVLNQQFLISSIVQQFYIQRNKFVTKHTILKNRFKERLFTWGWNRYCWILIMQWNWMLKFDQSNVILVLQRIGVVLFRKLFMFDEFFNLFSNSLWSTCIPCTIWIGVWIKDIIPKDHSSEIKHLDFEKKSFWRK